MINQKIPFVLKMVHVAAKMNGRVFTKALYKNVRAFESELAVLEKIKEPSPEYIAIRGDIDNVNAKYADREGINGVPKTAIKKLPNGQEVEEFVCTIPANITKRDDEIKAIQDGHPKIFEEHKEKVQKYITAMHDECDVNIIMVKEKDFPDNLSPEVMFSFDWMLKLDS